MLKNEYLIAKFGLDTAENDPCQVCPDPGARRRRTQAAGPRAAGAFENRKAFSAVGMSKPSAFGIHERRDLAKLSNVQHCTRKLFVDTIKYTSLKEI